MIYLYPANKMENLLALVDKIQQVSPLPVFSKEVFIVQNAGMQHWLNMSLAEKRGISLNVDYALPAQFLWKLARTLSNKGVEIDQAPFSREALCWRIYHLLGQSSLINNPVFSTVTQYWLENSSQPLEQECEDNATQSFSSTKQLKRYQLACQLADLYEQYLVFRPDWINEWGENASVAKNQQSTTFNEQFKEVEKWQAELWLLLIKDQDYNPAKILQEAADNVFENLSVLPKRICFFGINAMAPMWLSFINQLSEYIDVHFFHLNPCENYWGDILTDKQAISNSDQWVDNAFSVSVLSLIHI